MKVLSRKKSIASKSIASKSVMSSELHEGRYPAPGEQLPSDLEHDVVGRSEQSVEHHRPLEETVERMVGGEPDPGQYLLTVRGDRTRGATRRRLGERGGEG